MKIIGDMSLTFRLRQHNTKSAFHCSPGTAHLLVIMHHRTGALEMNYKCQVRLVETHTQRRGCHQHLDFIS